MKQLLFLTLLIFLFSCRSNSNANINMQNLDSTKYVHESIAFLKQVLGNELKDPTFLLADKPLAFSELGCLNEVLADSATYTRDEIAFMQQKKYITVSRWTKDIFPSFKFVSRDSINAFFKTASKGWYDFHKKFGDSYNLFSMPIFLRGYNYCLFYKSNHCGYLCGEGRLILYKRFWSSWKEVRSYCGWIS